MSKKNNRNSSVEDNCPKGEQNQNNHSGTAKKEVKDYSPHSQTNKPEMKRDSNWQN